MIDYNELINNNSINKTNLLLNYYHLLDINEDELTILLLIEKMISENILVTSKEIKKYMSLSLQTIDTLLQKLIEKKLLIYDFYSNKNNIDNCNVYDKIFEKIIEAKVLKNKQEQSYQLEEIISIYEKEFKKELSDLEKECLNEWFNTYKSEIIVFALKEAVLSDIITFRYIEKVIKEQVNINNG